MDDPNERKYAVLAVLLAVVVIVGCIWIGDSRIRDCHRKGGEIDFFSSTGALCLTPDGRVVK